MNSPAVDPRANRSVCNIDTGYRVDNVTADQTENPDVRVSVVRANKLQHYNIIIQYLRIIIITIM